MENRYFLKLNDRLSFQLIRKTPNLMKRSSVRGWYVDRETIEGPDGQTGGGDDLLPLQSEEWSSKPSDLPPVGEVRSQVEGDFRIEMVDGGWS